VKVVGSTSEAFTVFMHAERERSAPVIVKNRTTLD
jgi:hypothetical protein